jgi:Nucleotidyl transferase AbiEii toxin, Type IV TA system
VTAFDPHWGALPAAQRELWPHLAPSVKMGLVLYGGTASALRLGHRTSIDFDFFTERPIDPRELESAFDFVKQSRVIQQQRNTLSVLAPVQDGGVKVSFFGGIEIGRVGFPDLTHDSVIKVASLPDLLSTKLKVLLQRVESKDYKDIAAILRAGAKLETGLAGAMSMYGANFQPSEAMKALTYFEGGDLAWLPSSDREYLIRAVGKVRDIPALGIVSRSLS